MNGIHRRPGSLLIVLMAGALLALTACGGGSDGGSALETPAAGQTIAPEFPPGHTWFNVDEPLTIGGLRGKIVLLDFWTLGCINCQHIVPDLKRLEEEFPDSLVVIGVHSGKYDRERDDDSIREAVVRLGLQHPVVNDPDFAIWSAYGAHSWPTTVLIDPEGNIAGARSGEGVYAAVQPAVSDLAERFAASIDHTPLAVDIEAAPIASAFLNFPGAVLADEAGARLFIADSNNNRILVATLDGELQSAIGGGVQGFADGPAGEAQFNQPQGLALSPDGATLYVADTRNHAIRAVNLASGEVTTLAGTGERALVYPSPGAPGAATSLASPWGLLLDGRTLYIAMAGTHQIWTLDLDSGAVAIFAGSGAEGIADGPAASATLAQPAQLTTDGSTLYWVDPESSSVRAIALSGEGGVRTLAGTGLFDFGDADGPPGTALLQHPQGIAYVNGVLYVADTYNHKIRTVDPATAVVTTVAGDGSQGDADGLALVAAFDEPGGLSAAGDRLFVADTNNNAIRVFDLSSGDVSTLELTNLAVAVGSLPGRSLKTSLAAQTVGSGTTELRVQISAPPGFHLNELAPSMLTFTSSSEDVISVGDDALLFSTAEPSVELTVSVQVAEGQAILTATGTVYYCRLGEEGICLIDMLDLAAPFTVSAGAGQSEAAITYQLPE